MEHCKLKRKATTALQSEEELKRVKIEGQKTLEAIAEFGNLPIELKQYILTFLTADNLISLFKNLARAAQTESAVYALSRDENLIRHLINTHIQNQFKKNKTLNQITSNAIRALEFIQENVRKYKNTTDKNLNENLLEIISRIYKPIVQDLSKKYLISENSEGIDITDLDKNLEGAIRVDNLNAVRLILAAGANPNAKFDTEQEPALILAIKNPRIIRALLLAGADPNEKARYEDTALTFIAGEERGDMPMEEIKTLLEFGADPNILGYTRRTALMSSVGGEKIDINIVKLLLEDKRTDPNIQRPYSGYTALMIAKNLDAINMLLANGKTDPNVQDNYGETALMHAVRDDNEEKIMALLSHPKTNPNIPNRGGQTALSIAEAHGNDIIADIIRQHLKDDNQK